MRRLGLEMKRVASVVENQVNILHSYLQSEALLPVQLNSPNPHSSSSSPPQQTADLSSCSDVMKRCGNLCSMAFALYLFTNRQGPLKSPQDLFTQIQVHHLNTHTHTRHHSIHTHTLADVDRCVEDKSFRVASSRLK